jgi:ABC-type oligopeptide transport system ATPase subunit
VRHRPRADEQPAYGAAGRALHGPGAADRGRGLHIVKDLNSKEKVTFLLAEQNTNMALKYADYGYIMESGRIVMDGSARIWPATRTSRSSTWAWAAASARASRT